MLWMMPTIIHIAIFPLFLLRPDMAPFVVGQNQLCGVFNSDLWSGHWQSLSCDSALPYICKKTPNISRRAEPIGNPSRHIRSVLPSRHKHFFQPSRQIRSFHSSWNIRCFLSTQTHQMFFLSIQTYCISSIHLSRHISSIHPSIHPPRHNRSIHPSLHPSRLNKSKSQPSKNPHPIAPSIYLHLVSFINPSAFMHLFIYLSVYLLIHSHWSIQSDLYMNPH